MFFFGLWSDEYGKEEGIFIDFGSCSGRPVPFGFLFLRVNLMDKGHFALKSTEGDVWISYSFKTHVPWMKNYDC